MRCTVLFSCVTILLSAAAVSAQVPSPNLNTAGQQGMSAGATVVGIGPAGAMRGAAMSPAIGANWTTVNMGDRSMGASITGTGQSARGMMQPGVGSNFTTVNEQNFGGQRSTVTFQFGHPNLPYGPGANINTAVGRDMGLESAAINGGTNGYKGGGWRANGLAPPGVGSNYSTVSGSSTGIGAMTAAGSGRTWARGAPQQTGYAPQVARQHQTTPYQTGYSGAPFSPSWVNRFFGNGQNNTISAGPFGMYGNSFPSQRGAQMGGQYGGLTPGSFVGNGWNAGGTNAGFVNGGVNVGEVPNRFNGVANGFSGAPRVVNGIPTGVNGNPSVPSASNSSGFTYSGFSGAP